jgi:tRNA-specific 2-thiouridylase
VNWISGEGPAESRAARARIRYKHVEAPATITPKDPGKILVEFEKTQRAVTPGQAVVFYDGDIVLGGGIIDHALNGSTDGSPAA